MAQIVLSDRVRKFSKEVGSIVFGVLIALGLGALATEIGWRLEVRSARQQLRYELGHNFALLRYWESARDCTERRLDKLGEVMAEASATRRLPPLGAIEGSPYASWPRGVWESQNAAQTAAHYPSRELASISRLYRLFEDIKVANRAAGEAWVTLGMMSGPGRPLDVGTEAAIYSALAKARAMNNFPSDSVRRVMQRQLGSGYAQIDPESPPILRPLKICDEIPRTVAATYGG